MIRELEPGQIAWLDLNGIFQIIWRSDHKDGHVVVGTTNSRSKCATWICNGPVNITGLIQPDTLTHDLAGALTVSCDMGALNQDLYYRLKGLLS